MRIEGILRIWNSVGMGAGGVLFAALALAGLQALMLAVPALYVALKLAGGLSLAWLGLRIWRGARAPLPIGGAPPAGRRSLRGSLVLGFATQASNPKTAIVYASVCAAFLPAHVGVVFSATLLLLVFAIEAGWYALVALALSSPGPRAAYLRGKAWIDRLAGGVLMGLGLRLVASAPRA